MVGHAEQFVAISRLLRASNVQGAVGGDIEIGAVDILQGVSLAGDELDFDRGSLGRLLHQLRIRSQPATIQCTGDCEDATLGVPCVVNHPALGLGLVVVSRGADAQPGTLAGVGQGNT